MAAIVFLHGIGGCVDTWRAQVEHFSKTYQVLAWSAPGFGGTARLDELTFESLASRLAVDMKAAGISEAVVVGHSFGGMVAQQFVKDFSEMVSHLVLIGTSPAFGRPDGEFQKKFVADRTRPLDEGMSMAEMARAGVGNLLGPDAAAGVADQVCAAMSKVPEQTYRDVVQLLTSFDLKSNLAHINVPALLVVGEHDAMAPPPMMERMGSYIADARFETLAGVGHMTQMEDPGNFNRLLEDFIAES